MASTRINNRPSAFQAVIGQVFGKLTVIGTDEVKAHQMGRHKNDYWRCRCECGKEVSVFKYSVVKGHSTTCGCGTIAAHTIHGLAKRHEKHPMYFTWRSMKARCNDPKHRAYPTYGAIGIKVCERWLDFVLFLEDMFPTWKKGLTLDRIENNKGYFKENCKWSTKKEQMNNTSSSVFVEYAGQRLTVTQWAEKLGIKYECLRGRFKAGWTPEQALTRPVDGSANRILNTQKRRAARAASMQ